MWEKQRDFMGNPELGSDLDRPIKGRRIIILNRGSSEGEYLPSMHEAQCFFLLLKTKQNKQNR